MQQIQKTSVEPSKAVASTQPTSLERPQVSGILESAAQALKSTPVADLLRRGKRVIADPIHWVKGQYVMRRPNKMDNKYCAIGALYEADGAYDKGTTTEAYSTAHLILQTHAQAVTGGHSVQGFNDSSPTTHPDVMALYDLAIETAEKEGK